MRPRISGSKADRVWKCPASAALPFVDRVDDSVPAIRGRDVHRYLQRAKVVGIDVAIAEQPEALRPYLSTIDVASLPTNLATEVAFAFDWRARTSRELGRDLDRGYVDLGPSEDPLTVDLLGVDLARRRGYVGDYKTGHTRYPHASRFGQLLLGAACAAIVYDLDDVEVELIYLDTAGDDRRSRGVVDRWELEAWILEWCAARDLVETYRDELRAGRQIPVREGRHCDHCESFNYCPAQIGLVRSLHPGQWQAAGDTALASIQRPGYLAPDRLADSYRMVQRMRAVLHEIEQEICGQARLEPIDLGEGEWLGEVTPRPSEHVIGHIAAAVLEARYGADAARSACEISTSKEAIRDLVASKRGPNEVISSKHGTGVLDLVLAEIRTRGGTETKQPAPRVRTFTRKPKP